MCGGFNDHRECVPVVSARSTSEADAHIAKPHIVCSRIACHVLDVASVPDIHNWISTASTLLVPRAGHALVTPVGKMVFRGRVSGTMSRKQAAPAEAPPEPELDEEGASPSSRRFGTVELDALPRPMTPE